MPDGVASGVGAALGVGQATIELSLAETTGHTSVPTWGWAIPLAQTWGSSPDATYVVIWGPSASDTLTSTDTLSPGLTYYPVQTDAPTLQDALTPGWPKEATDTIQMSPDLTVSRAVTVLEGLGLLGPATVAATYRPVFIDVIEYSDVLRRFFGGDLSETMGVDPALTVLPRLARTAKETYGIAAEATPVLVIRITLAEETGLADADTPKAIFGLTVAEGVELTAAYVAPDGNVTTWAINSRTGAVTEYQNYNFNSFAQIGHKYLGASSDGLFELIGDDDDGTDIISKVRSGYSQFNGSRFSGFKAAYLGIRAEGDLVFRLLTGDGRTYNYAVKARDMETVKVQLGKGLRARYFAFELESTGQDFDLETVELVPMVSTRRV